MQLYEFVKDKKTIKKTNPIIDPITDPINYNHSSENKQTQPRMGEMIVADNK